jgi:hypothetical protein
MCTRSKAEDDISARIALHPLIFIIILFWDVYLLSYFASCVLGCKSDTLRPENVYCTPVQTGKYLGMYLYIRRLGEVVISLLYDKDCIYKSDDI